MLNKIKVMKVSMLFSVMTLAVGPTNVFYI